MAADATRLVIAHDGDIVEARQKGRELAQRIGFSGSEPTIIATAISEIARNIVVYADHGEISLSVADNGARRLMDDFDIMPTVGEGTTVTMRKWKR